MMSRTGILQNEIGKLRQKSIGIFVAKSNVTPRTFQFPLSLPSIWTPHHPPPRPNPAPFLPDRFSKPNQIYSPMI